MSLSQPGSVTAAGSHAQPPAFASQPGTATAAAAAQFVPPPELAAAGAGGYAAGYADAQVGGGAAARYGGGYGEGQAGGANPEGGSGGAYGDPEGGGSFGAAAALPLSCSGDAEGGGGGGAHEYHAGGYGGGEASVEAATEAAAGDGGATAEASGAYNPAEYLQQLEAHLGALHLQRRDLEGQLVAAATSGYQAMSARLSGAGAGVPLGSNVPALVDELAVLQSARQYLAYLQELQALTRHVDKSVRALQQQQQQQAAGGGGGADPAAFVAAASEAVDSFSNSVGYAIAVRQLTEQGKMPVAQLQQYARGLLARVEGAQQGLRALLGAAIQQRLKATHWPPPLTVGGEGGGEGGAAWRGFAAAGEASMGELQQLLVLLLTLQRASQHEEFSALSEAGQEGSWVAEELGAPLLWIAEELAAPLADRLRHHFAGGLPTDRRDRPEWLFATALKAAQQCGPLAQELQPCVDAHQLQAWYSLPLEVARAVQAVGVNAVVGEHLLPQLVSAADPSLWLHFADEAMRFEKRFAPLRGASLALPEEEDFLAAAHPGSTIELLFRRPEWQDGWLHAEQWDASRQLDAACDALPAWQPAAEQLLAAAGQELDMVPDTPRSRAGAAWRREFWPPVCAEQVGSLVAGLVRRGGWVHGAGHRLRYAQAVPLATLRAFRQRCSGLLLQAEQFRGLLGETWLPRVGAAICAAHYLEHQLREPQGVLLLAELQDAASGPADADKPAAGAAADGASAVAAANGAAGGVAPAGGEPGGWRRSPLGKAAVGAAVEGGKASEGQARSLVALLEREAADFGALRKQWAYKLAKQAVEAFHQLFAPYKRDASTFTAGWEEGVPAEQLAAGAAAAGPAAPSPAMLQAADGLQQLLRALAQHLDAVVFRDVWKGVALAVNYAFYNEVATEALFSAEGAARLDADLSAVSSAVFGEYTSRPAAHFKESREACRLLALPPGDALGLLSQLETAPRAAKELLAPHGVRSLNAEQAAVVLLQRLDVLTARNTGRGGGGGGGGGGFGQPFKGRSLVCGTGAQGTMSGKADPRLEAGRRKLEEFKRKKQQALAGKKGSSATTSPEKPPSGAASYAATAPAGLDALPPGRPTSSSASSGPPPPPYAAANAPADGGEAESLRQQVGQLLESVDELHRALHDERANSTQLEERLAEQQAQLRALTDANAQLSAAEGASASDAEAAAAAAAAAEQAQRELAQARAQAERYAAAAENLSSELGAARQEADAAAAQLAAVQEAAAVQLAAGQEAAADEAAAAQEGNFSLIADYKQQLDEAREALEAQAAALAAAQAGAGTYEGQLVALSTQLAQQQQDAEELHAELARQRDLNARMRHELAEQAAAAEEAVQAEEEEHSALALAQQRIAELEASTAAAAADAAAAAERRAAVEAEAAATAAAAAEAEASLQEEVQHLSDTVAALQTELRAKGEAELSARAERGGLEAQLAELDALRRAYEAASAELEQGRELAERQAEDIAQLREDVAEAVAAGHAQGQAQAQAQSAALLEEQQALLEQLQEGLAAEQEARAAAEAAAAAAAEQAAAAALQLRESEGGAAAAAAAHVQQLQAELEGSQQAVAALQQQLADVAEVQQQLDAAQSELTDTRWEAASLQQQLAEAAAAAQHAEQLQAELASSQDAAAAAYQQLEQVQAELTSSQDAAAAAHQQLEQVQAELAGTREEAAALQQQLADAAAAEGGAAAALQEQLEGLQAELAAAREAGAAAQAEAEQARGEAATAVQWADEVEGELMARADEAAELRQRLEEAVQQQGGEAAAVAALQQQAADLAEELAALQQQYAAEHAAAGVAELSLQAAQAAAAQAEAQAAEVRGQLAERDADVALLQQLVEAARAGGEGAAAAGAEAEALRAALAEAQAAAAAAEQEKGHYAGELEVLIQQAEGMLAERAQLEQQQEEAAGQLAEAQQQAAELQDRLAALEAAAAADGGAAEQLAALQTDLEDILSSRDAVILERDAAQQQAAAAQQQAAELQQRVEAATAGAAGAQGQDAAVAAEVEALRQHSEALAQELAAAQAAAAAAAEQAQALAEALQQQNEVLGARVAQLEAAATAAAAAESAGGGQAEAVLGDLQRENATLQAAVAEYSAQVQQWSQRAQQLEAAAAAGFSSGDAAARLSAAQQAAAQAEVQATALQAENRALREQVAAEQRRAAEVESYYKERAGGQAAPASKKDEDASFDVEAAALTGGGTMFKPLAGVVRALPAPFSHQALVKAATQLDRGAIALDTRPQLRAGLALYFLLLHLPLDRSPMCLMRSRVLPGRAVVRSAPQHYRRGQSSLSARLPRPKPCSRRSACVASMGQATMSPSLVHAYLDRIGLPAAAGALPPPTLPTLAALHWAHLCSVPFENLSLRLEAAQKQHGIHTDLQSIYQKLVGSRRGGYCYEQNALFGAVLRSLGFDVVDGAARVVQPPQREAGGEADAVPLLDGVQAPAPELRLTGHDHHVLFVWLDGRLWLADVGFGGQVLPLPLALPAGAERYAAPAPADSSAGAYGGPHKDAPWASGEPGGAASGAAGGAGGATTQGLPVERLERYRLRLGLPGTSAVPDAAATRHMQLRAGYYLQHRSLADGSWKYLYFFRLDEFLPQDYAIMNHYITQHLQSYFRHNTVVARETREGRVTLFNSTFRRWREGEAAPHEEREVEGEAALLALLADHFDLRFTAEEAGTI